MQNVPHNSESPIRPVADSPDRTFRRAFTLMEMVVSIGILVIVILSVGVIFQSAGRAVGVSESSMEMLSNVRAVQQQLEADVSGMDKGSFLVIRGATYTDGASGIIRRCDQISFVSRGAFPNRTGAYTTFSPYTDNNTVVPAAFVWWGQGAFEASTGSSGESQDPRTSLSTDVSVKVPLNQVPTGLIDTNGLFVDSSVNLCRHTMLLVPPTPAGSNSVAPAGLSVMSYPNQTVSGTNSGAAIDWANPTLVQGISTDAAADITQSRVSVARVTPSLLMSYLMQGLTAAGGRAAAPRYEADHFCYRYAALRSPYDGSSLVNGFFRMHPIALQGVSTFSIDWTDGSVFGASDTDPTTGNTVAAAVVGTTRWYGYLNPRTPGGGVDPSGAAAGNNQGDIYCAVFSYDNTALWPVALRFRYHVSDPAGRLVTGRDFVEVVKVPN